MSLARTLLGAGLRPSLLTLAGGVAILCVLGGVVALQAQVLPPPEVWLALVGLAPLASSPILVPLVLTVGVVAPLRAWQRQGTWQGALASGLSGRRLVPLALIVGLVGAAFALVATTQVEPWARRQARELASAHATGVELHPGRAVQVGALTLRPLEGDDLVLVEAPGALGVARSVRLVRSDGELALELAQAHLGTEEGGVQAERWLRPLPSPQPPRIELAQRGTADLARAVERTARSGGDASYEGSVLLKRFLHPLAVLLLPLALVPLALRRRPWITASLLGVSWLAAIRAGDHLASVVGAWPAASTGLVWVLAWALVAWLGWRER